MSNLLQIRNQKDQTQPMFRSNSEMTAELRKSMTSNTMLAEATKAMREQMKALRLVK